MKHFLTLLAAALTTAAAFSQPGTIDKTFGEQGFVATQKLSYHYAIVQQPDGKLLTSGGYNDPKGNVARFLTDGTLDSTFGTSGFATGGGASDIVLQPDNKILVVGQIRNEAGALTSSVVRYNPNGKIDSSFGINGICYVPDYKDYSSYNHIVLKPDGTIIISGSGQTDIQAVIPDYSFISRLSANGTFDESFGTGGRILNYEIVHDRALALQKDGGILLGGDNFGGDKDFLISRYKQQGILDINFGINGIVATDGLAQDNVTGIVVQPDGKIIAGGYSGAFGDIAYMTAFRYTTNGVLDNTFGTGGKTFVSFENRVANANALLLQPDGKIILAGAASVYPSQNNSFALCRLNSNGAVDSSFAINGRQVTPYGASAAAKCAVLQQDGKIVLGGGYYTPKKGYDSYLLVRYNGDQQQRPLIVKVKRWLNNHGLGWQGLETNVNYYSVQYSKNADAAFIEKGRISGAGSSPLRQYNFDVANPGYYRIVATDKEGYKTFSNKVGITTAQTAATATAYPNPATNYVVVNGLTPNTKTTINLADANGNVLTTGISNGATQYRCNTDKILPGTYYLQLQTISKMEIVKFVKQ